MGVRDEPIPKDLYERAFALLRTTVHKWNGPVCALRRDDDRFTLDASLFRAELDKSVRAYTPEGLALRLADALGLPAGEELVLDDVVRALPVLRPRIVRREILDGPAKSMCRRDLGADLLVGVALGRRTMRNFVTTRMLDAWKMTFDEVLQSAVDELMRRFTIGDIRLYEVDHRALCVRHEREPAASVALGLERLVEGIDQWPGAFLGTPTEDTLLVIPLDDDSDLRALGAIIETCRKAVEERDDALSTRPLWLHAGRLHPIGLRFSDEDRGRRAVVETSDPVLGYLLRVLSGEDDGPPPPDSTRSR
jgi:hypothetical protein